MCLPESKKVRKFGCSTHQVNQSSCWNLLLLALCWDSTNASLQFSGTASRKAPPCVPPGPRPTWRPSWTQTRPRRSVRQIETKLTDVCNMELRSVSAGREGTRWVSNEETCYLDCFNLLLLLRQAQCLLYCYLGLVDSKLKRWTWKPQCVCLCVFTHACKLGKCSSEVQTDHTTCRGSVWTSAGGVISWPITAQAVRWSPKHGQNKTVPWHAAIVWN